MPLSEAKKRMGIFFVLTTAVLVACFILTAVYSGFVHESKRFRTMVMTMVLSLIFQMLLWEPLRFIVLAIDHATWPQEDHGYTAEKGETKPSHITYLKARLRGLRSELLITDNHRNEALNQKYKRIAHDLFLYGSYFLTLLLNILVGEDPYLYYNTNIMTRLFKENTSITMGLSYIEFFDDVGSFKSILNALTAAETPSRRFTPSSRLPWWMASMRTAGSTATAAGGPWSSGSGWAWCGCARCAPRRSTSDCARPYGPTPRMGPSGGCPTSACTTRTSSGASSTPFGRSMWSPAFWMGCSSSLSTKANC